MGGGYDGCPVPKIDVARTANVNGSKLRNMVIPLPPFAEQERILAKVEELMALCDRLEARLDATDSVGRQLLEAVLHHALSDTLESASPIRPVPQADRLPPRIPSFQ